MIHFDPLPESFREFLLRASTTFQLPLDLTYNPVPIIQTTSTMARLSYAASTRLLLFLMLVGFIDYAITNISTTNGYLSVLPVGMHAIVPYVGSFVMNGIAGLLNYLSHVPMDSNTIISYLGSFAINSVIRLLIVRIVFKRAE